MNLINASSTPFAGCGIVGAMEFYKNAFSKVNTDAMLQSLAHRGPDAVNSLTDGPVWFGHRRLSILDLSERGNQPMTRDHLTIISNVEVYNYRNIRQKLFAKGYFFTSDTDTEVILRAFQEWGIEALNEMNGMFAFAIWENQ
jgi:asparagine synthase (glutamine-hydrolysing)